ncbi:MAG: PorV/PorQ family protein [bacterium]
MRRMLTSIEIVAFVLILTSYTYAGGPGTTAANFLKIGVGARATAMGEAFTALADDGTSLYWNPAGLSQIKGGELSATYNLWFDDIRQGYLSIGFPSLGGTLGLAANYVDMGTLEGRDRLGNPTGNFTASDLEMMVGYARKIFPTFNIGFGVGIIQDTIAEDKESAFLANLGLLTKVSKPLSLGFVVQNIGTELASDPLPLTLRVGLALRPGPFTVALDLVKSTDDDTYYCVGAEWWIAGLMALRLGYKSNQDTGSGLTAGLGFKVATVDLDYAYVDYGDLGNTHRISMGFKW